MLYFFFQLCGFWIKLCLRPWRVPNCSGHCQHTPFSPFCGLRQLGYNQLQSSQVVFIRSSICVEPPDIISLNIDVMSDDNAPACSSLPRCFLESSFNLPFYVQTFKLKAVSRVKQKCLFSPRYLHARRLSVLQVVLASKMVPCR